MIQNLLKTMILTGGLGTFGASHLSKTLGDIGQNIRSGLYGFGKYP